MNVEFERKVRWHPHWWGCLKLRIAHNRLRTLTDTDRRRRADDRIENVNIKWGGGQPEEREVGGMGWVLHAHTHRSGDCTHTGCGAGPHAVGTSATHTRRYR